MAFSFLFAGIGANYHIMHLLMMLSWHVWSQPSTDPTQSECTNGFPRCCKKQPQFHSNFTFILRNNAHQCWPSTNVYFAKQTVTVCSFIHRFQLFTKVQFTKACWTKLPSLFLDWKLKHNVQKHWMEKPIVAIHQFIYFKLCNVHDKLSI